MKWLQARMTQSSFFHPGFNLTAVNFGGTNNAEFNPNSTASGGNVVLKNSKGSLKTISCPFDDREGNHC